VIDLAGVFAPAVTPFDVATGDADIVAMRANVRRWLEAPLRGILLFGSTGEGVFLDEDERDRLLQATRDAMPADRLLLAGVASESTRGAIHLCRTAATSGADAVLVQPPAYYRPQMTPEALREHFLAVAEASPVPVLLYQVPSRFSSIELSAGLVGELARHENVAGIKDSSGDLKTLSAYVEACAGRCAVLAGSGAVLYGALEVGASGGVLALALLAPRQCAEIVSLRASGAGGRAGAVQERVAPLHRAVVGELGIPGIKKALDLLGAAGGPPRPPLLPLKPRLEPSVRAALVSAGLLET
jgi:4-hydroxy-2-oxoglutarate aldolase